MPDFRIREVRSHDFDLLHQHVRASDLISNHESTSFRCTRVFEHEKARRVGDGILALSHFVASFNEVFVVSARSRAPSAGFGIVRSSSQIGSAASIPRELQSPC